MNALKATALKIKTSGTIVALALLMLWLNVSCRNQNIVLSPTQIMNGGYPASDDFQTKIPFEYINNAIIVKVKVGKRNRECRFLIDNTKPTQISYKVAREEGILPEESAIAFGRPDPRATKYGVIETLQIGDVTFKSVGCVVGGFVKNTSSYSRCHMKNIDGILGGGVLPLCIWQIDYEKKEITLTDDINKLAFEGEVQALAFSTNTTNGRIILDESMFFDAVEMKQPQVILNSSARLAGGENIYQELNRRKYLRHLEGKSVVFHLDDTTLVRGKTYYGLPYNVKVGSMFFDNIITEFSAQHNDFAIIGNRFLEKFKVVVDYLGQMVYFVPIKDRKPDNVLNGYGFFYIHSVSENKILVSLVLGDSPADKAGLRVGDQIVRINDVDVSTITSDFYCALNDVNKLTGPEAKNKISISFKGRGGDIQTVTITKEDLLRNE